MKEIMLMTPGPTAVHKRVLNAMGKQITNPDLNREFFDFYKDTCDKFKRIIDTDNDVLLLSGEGILGLEAACASLIEPGDRVLCIENGIFGDGFGDFVDIYKGEKTYFHGDKRRGIDIEKLGRFLEENNDFKVATLVHCETPSGMTNDIKGICELLNNYGIISIVDSVSAAGGEELHVDKWGVDILLCGSQKCFSSTPGLTMLSISDRAYECMENRKTPIAGFYCNLLIWKDWYNKSFPYTQPVTEIYAISEAFDIVLEDKNFMDRHKQYGDATRYAVTKAGLELYPKDSYANTVTSIVKPDVIDFDKLFNYMIDEHGIMIAGAFSVLENKVIRIGHMGVGCEYDSLYKTLKGLRMGLQEQGMNVLDAEEFFEEKLK